MINKITSLLSSYAFPVNNEKVLQREIARVFEDNDINYRREVDLRHSGGGGIVDFVVDRIAIEVKIKGAVSAQVYRQCRGYCQSTEVDALLLVTNAVVRLPDEIDGKLCYVLSLGVGHL
jgi:hypothetical protein